MSFLTPLALVGALLAIPIILMYMLRLRRREVSVSSTFLWQQILRDREANTPWQKLKRNLLLFLQLLILALLVLALARPFITVPAVSSGQIALLLDASASMNATDSADGTRFAEARRRALEIVDTMSDGDTMTIVRVAEVPEVLAPYTGDRAVLRDAISRAQPSRASADWGAALTLAAAGAAGAEDFNIVLISDGGLGEAATLPAIPGAVQLVTVGQSNSNVAITALATRSLGGEPPQLFAQITNYGDADAEVIFNLRVDGDLFTAERYTIPAGGDFPLVSAALPEGFATLQAGLTIPAESTVPDYLPDDNTAWAVSSGAGSRRILLMSPGNLFVEQVLRSLPTAQVFIGDINRGMPTGRFDLVILDSWLPPTLPPGDLLIINPPQTSALFTVGAESEATDNIRVRREDPRMTFVDFDTVNIRAFTPVSAEWAEPLIETDDGALLIAGEAEGRQVAVLGFDLFETDLPLQIAWPVLMAGLLDWYQPQDIISAPEGLDIGESLLVRPPANAESLRVVLPDGETRNLPADRSQVVFAETGEAGVYTVEVWRDGEVRQRVPFAVNLFDTNESDIAPQTTVTLGEETISEAEEAEVGQREFWPWLVLAALLVLLLEWYAYHRRLRAPVAFRPLAGRRS